MTTEELLACFSAEWRPAVQHPFLDGVRDGTLPESAFTTWLAQDYLFVGDLLRFQACLLARAPRADQAVLIGGLSALEQELGWFEEQATGWGVGLDVHHHPSAARYRDFLRSLESEPYTAGIVALWALERAYLDAWAAAAPGAPRFRPFVEHWTVPPFAAYVADLARAADAALAPAPPAVGQAAFLGVAHHEAAFWAIATD